jgi:isoleucyl-tRNA synthetase
MIKKKKKFLSQLNLQVQKQLIVGVDSKKGIAMTTVKSSVRLPKTSFSMKAHLAQTEPITLKFWQEKKVYETLQKRNENGPLFTLHDGPPYANGHLHMGHALNKILKDIIIKYKAMHGYHTPYTPGWDCHGLPIEWMVEANYKEKGQTKDQISTPHFRSACREFAEKWVKIQSEEFQRLGVLGDWQRPYLTMDKKNEKRITEKLFTFLNNGGLYKSVKPVYWSVVEQTALAEAEVEYKDKKSPSIFVGFHIQKTPDPDLVDAQAVIWTTTPWTLPANRAIAYHPDITYVLVRLSKEGEPSRRIIIAKELTEAFANTTGFKIDILKEFPGIHLNGTNAKHPWYGQGYNFDVPLLPGEHVTLDQGTGLVHTAPGHGQEDFILGKKFGLEIAQPISDSGTYYDHIPLWAREHVYKVNPKIIASLQECGSLLYQSELTHSYPHSWRSKAPLIFRTTPQWFISMEKNQLREKALKTIDGVRWIPEQGRNRLWSMVADRPDWCLSRQRIWGIPLPLFLHKETQEILKDSDLNAKILEKIGREGTDFWFQENIKQELLSPKYMPDEYEKCTDILDVWFESGASYSFIEQNSGSTHLPIDLYLEGSDQHRGWFQSTLLIALGADGSTPYKTVLTHGFIVDEHGYKLSKSKGNAVNLDDVLKQDGADILRLWVAGSDYQEDMRLGKQIIKFQQENYRKLRNTLRFMLGNLPKSGVQDITYQDLPILEKFTLHQLACATETCKKHLENYNIHGIYRTLFTLSVSLSSFYFDIRKDTLYCEGSTSHQYKACVYVLNILFKTLTKWLAPILSFTAEEAWQNYIPGGNSIFLQSIESCPLAWKNDGISEKMGKAKSLRSFVNGCLEKARENKIIGSSLDASVTVYLPSSWESTQDNISFINFFTLEEWADFFIVSSVAFVKHPGPDFIIMEDPEAQGIAIKVGPHNGKKCARCWKYSSNIKVFGDEKADVCPRCYEVLNETS